MMTTNLGRTLLHCAVLAGDVQQVRDIAQTAVIREQDILGMTALDLAQRLISKFEQGATMHSNLSAIIAHLSELKQQSQVDEIIIDCRVSPLIRSTSNPEAAQGAPAGMFCGLRKAASDGVVAKSQTVEANLLRGMQRFTPLAVLRLVSDTDGIVERTVSTDSPGTEGAANQLAAEEELAILKDYISRDEPNQPDLEIAKYSTDGTCEICFTNPIVAGETPKGCDHCETPVCAVCLYSFTKSSIDAALYAVPAIRCPSCLARIRTAGWSAIFERYAHVIQASFASETPPLVTTDVTPSENTEASGSDLPANPSPATEEIQAAETTTAVDAQTSEALEAQSQHNALSLITKYKANGSNLLTYRCTGCDSTMTLYPDRTITEHAERKQQLSWFLEHFEQEQSLKVCKLLKAFNDAEINALALITELVPMYISAMKKGNTSLEELRQLEESKIFPGGWDVEQFRTNLTLIFTDVERRVGCLLAFVCQYPKYNTECCGNNMCFMCKTLDWHKGLTCAEVQATQTANAEFCPGCGVATLRTHGCRHMVCVCGTEWTWEGGDDYSY